MTSDVAAYDSFGAPLLEHQVIRCDFCGKPFASPSAAELCCSWDGRGWD